MSESKANPFRKLTELLPSSQNANPFKALCTSIFELQDAVLKLQKANIEIIKHLMNFEKRIEALEK